MIYFAAGFILGLSIGAMFSIVFLGTVTKGLVDHKVSRRIREYESLVKKETSSKLVEFYNKGFADARR